MNKEFIPYEEALALKELGFDEECIFGFIGESFGLRYSVLFLILYFMIGIGLLLTVEVKPASVAPILMLMPLIVSGVF